MKLLTGRESVNSMAKRIAPLVGRPRQRLGAKLSKISVSASAFGSTDESWLDAEWVKSVACEIPTLSLHKLTNSKQ